jgi:hypothetical protein
MSDDGQLELNFDQPKRRSFINPKGTRDAAADAMERAERLSDDHWKIEMSQAIRVVAEHMEYLTADHVWDQLGQVGDGERDDGSGLGPRLLEAQRSGIIQRADHQKSQRPVTHGKPITLWKSLIFRKGDGP